MSNQHVSVSWHHAGVDYDLIGIEQSKSNPDKKYQVVIADDGAHRWVSCNCPAFCISRKNKGLQQWERSCRHTKKYSLNSPALTSIQAAATLNVATASIERELADRATYKRGTDERARAKRARFAFLEL